jgi:hypothetical protein
VPEVLIRPAEGVQVVHGRWVHPSLGISAPAPPLSLSPDSPPDDFCLVEDAVNQGLASSAPGCGRRWRRFASSFVLPTSTARPLPGSVARAVATTFTAVAGASVPLLASSAALSVVFRVARQGPLALLAGACVAFLLSLAIHECGHVAAFRALAPRGAPAMLITRRSGSFVVRPTLTRARDVMVTLSGPVLPALVSLPAWGLLGRWPVESATVLLIAAGHLLYLMFPAGDGRALLDALSSVDDHETPLEESHHRLRQPGSRRAVGPVRHAGQGGGATDELQGWMGTGRPRLPRPTAGHHHVVRRLRGGRRHRGLGS